MNKCVVLVHELLEIFVAVLRLMPAPKQEVHNEQVHRLDTQELLIAQQSFRS